MGYHLTSHLEIASRSSEKHTRNPQTSSRTVESGKRFYNPDAGRWLNRDPIGEDGGLNLYSAFLNDPVGHYDLLGNVVPVAPVIIIVVGSVAIEVGLSTWCFCKFKRGEEAYVRTPAAVLAHFSGGILAIIQTVCDGPGTIRTRIRKEEGSDTCHSDLVIICDGKAEQPGKT